MVTDSEENLDRALASLEALDFLSEEDVINNSKYGST